MGGNVVDIAGRRSLGRGVGGVARCWVLREQPLLRLVSFGCRVLARGHHRRSLAVGSGGLCGGFVVVVVVVFVNWIVGCEH